jgi:hypothetical protein
MSGGGGGDSGGWARGYPVGFGYTQSFQPELAPLHLDYVLASRGCRGPGAGAARPFRYCELGCGRGVTLCMLAAANPRGSFVGYDFMPNHIAAARRLAEEAGLDNVRFEEMDFAALVAGADPGPPFDYIALHGVYAWVDSDTRREIVAILAGRTAPGAAVYVGYNAMPGWAYLEPLRRVFSEASKAVRGATATDAAEAGKAAVDAWVAVDPNRPMVGEAWRRLKRFSSSFLLHELGVSQAGGLWSTDVAGELAAAKLRYVALARLIENFDALQFPAAFKPFLLEADAAGFGTVARDILRNRVFRSDVFVRGLPDMNAAEVAAVLGGFHVVAAGVRPRPAGGEDEDDLDEDFAPGIDEALEKKLLDAVGEGVVRIGDIGGGLDASTRMKAVAALIALGRLRLAADPDTAAAAAPATARLTAVAARRLGLDASLPALPSARLGSALLVSDDEQRAIFGRDDAGAELRLKYAALGIAG